MAVRYRRDRNKWLAIINTEGGSKSRCFDTEAEALQWEAAALQGLEEAFVKARAKREFPAESGTMGGLLAHCAKVDWADTEPMQWERARVLVRFLGASTRPCEITEETIDEIVVWRRGQGNSNGTINRYLSALSVMLKRARRLRWINQVPLFPERRTLKEAEPRDLVLPDQWLQLLLDRLEYREQREAYQAVVFLRQMGCRAREALSLSWDRVDLAGGTVQFVKTKGGEARRLPLPAAVEQLLRAREASQGEVFRLTYDQLHRAYNEARDWVCDTLRLDDATRREWVIHTLRHTRLTELASAGATAPQIRQWAGHSSLSMTQRYVHGSAIDLRSLV